MQEVTLTEQELRDLQYKSALSYVQGIRDRYLIVDWKSIKYYAGLFK